MKEQDEKLIHKYLREELNSQEIEILNHKIDSDNEFKKRFDLELNLYDALDENSWSFIRNTNSIEIKNLQSLFRGEESRILTNKIIEAQAAYYRKSNTKRKWIAYSIIAAVFIAINTIILWPNKLTNQDLYSEYLRTEDLIELVDRGRSDSIFSSSQKAFNRDDFSKVIELLSPEIENSTNGNIYIYLAIAHMERSDYLAADKILDLLINSELLDSQKGYWYRSLLYIKSDRINDAKKVLKIIIDQNYYNRDNALELLDRID